MDARTKNKKRKFVARFFTSKTSLRAYSKSSRRTAVNRFISAMFSALMLSLLIVGKTQAAAPTAAQINQARVAGLAWLMTHQIGDGSWKDASGGSVTTTSVGLNALVNAGVKQGYPFTSALAYLQNAQPGSVEALSRQIGALNNLGVNVAPQAAVLNQWRNDSSAWGAYKSYGSSLPDTPLAMSTLFQLGTFDTDNSYNTLCFGLLYAVRSDNSFSYFVNGASTPTSQSSGNLIPTAYATVTLKAAPANTGWTNITCQRLENGSYVPTTYALNTVMNNAVTWMLGKQNATDGGFGDAGSSTILETAVVYAALNQISASTYAMQLGNAQGYLIAQQNTNGSWGEDPLATALALQTLPTLAANTLADANKNGLPDAVETFLGKNPNVADRSSALGNGLAVSGNTVSQSSGNGTQSQSFNRILTPPSGTSGPYTWAIASGYLPDGLTLNTSTGAITGTPGTSGTFNFQYSVTDVAGTKTTVAAQIVVAAANFDSDIPTLPQWGAILLALLLMGSMVHKSRDQWI